MPILLFSAVGVISFGKATSTELTGENRNRKKNSRKARLFLLFRLFAALRRRLRLTGALVRQLHDEPALFVFLSLLIPVKSSYKRLFKESSRSATAFKPF
ncbi:MAG: hypothetical protein LBJ64_09465 [Deltaproteobacteria bacterium]|nr:hypothetical protein [Deltaproteobacteria bacterium]